VLELADGPDLVPTGRIDSAGIGWTLTGRHLDLLQGAALSAAPQGETTRSGLTGACLLVTRGAYERLVGSTGELFDEDFFAYREDAELGVRAGLIGVRSVLVPQARALHGRALRGTTRGGSALIDRLGVRNRLLLLFKLGHHRPGFTPAALARDLVVIAAAATVERSSWPGVTQAWALHTTMRAKRRRWTSAV
jgi:GT2 family glycosyltransferase